MSAVDAVDFVDMLEKHGFTRTEAKMFIDFNQARVATKDDLNVININLSNKIEKEILSVKSELKDEINKVEKETLLLRQEIVKGENKILTWVVTGFVITILAQIFLKFFA